VKNRKKCRIASGGFFDSHFRPIKEPISRRRLFGLDVAAVLGLAAVSQRSKGNWSRLPLVRYTPLLDKIITLSTVADTNKKAYAKVSARIRDFNQ